MYAALCCYNVHRRKHISPRVKVNLKIDLHSHTTASDGKLTPEELVLRAANLQVDVLAITDHDTMDGIHQAKQTVSKHALNLKLIAGIEISTLWQSRGIHIVGLNVNAECERFEQFIQQQKRIRQERAHRIAYKLEKTGFAGIYQHAAAQAMGGEITRAHFARALVQEYGLTSMEQAFKRFLGKGNAGDVKAQWPSIAEAVDAIQHANGQAVLAHPLKYDLSSKWLRKLVAHFSDVGGDAIEISGPGVQGDKLRFIEELAEQGNLKASVGSDFHSPGRWTELGRYRHSSERIPPVWQNWQLSGKAV